MGILDREFGDIVDGKGGMGRLVHVMIYDYILVMFNDLCGYEL